MPIIMLIVKINDDDVVRLVRRRSRRSGVAAELAWLLLRAAEGKIDLPPDGTSLEYQHGAFIVSTGK